MDMCTGPLFKKMVKFAIPLILTVFFQQLFNTADLVVVGKFGRDGALAAVGATSSATNLIINFFVGLSVGAGICMARFYGAKEQQKMQDCIHTSVLLSIAGGIILAVAGWFLSPLLMEAMDTPKEVIKYSIQYMRIYFLGMPFIMLFNFSASLLRAVGDSKRTLYYIATAGVINVLLNLIFVIVLDMNVAGVALATVISQCYSAFMSVKCFLKYEGALHIDVKKLKINKAQLKSISTLGIPSGIQGSLFSLSNVIIQSSINSFGAAAMSGSAASSNIEHYVYIVMNGISNTTTNFTGQNFGAGNFKRIKKVMLYSLLLITVLGLILGIGVRLAGNFLLGLYTDIPAEIEVGLTRLTFIAIPYFLCGLMEIFSGLLKGLYHPVSSMIVSLIGACLFRIVWIYTVFAKKPSLITLYISYPISWFLTSLVLAVLFFIFVKKDENKFFKPKA